ncbi:unnamed protein product [Phytomonas sp. Hart1]|nr:unnamed protein product [Phytomonas sp. Hart1]|eukprot:CCW71135.1 unnamed protein product [Phytomonas sp. isolate Hart1]
MLSTTIKNCFSEVTPSASSSVSIEETTPGNDASFYLSQNFNDSLEDELQSKAWVQVLGLESGTTNARLKKMFYPYGADEAFICTENCHVVGFVGFELSDMAEIAIDKMNGFIPCLQSHLLSVSLASLERVIAAWLKSRETHAISSRLFAKLSFAIDPTDSLVASIEVKSNNQGVYAVVDEIMGDLKQASPSTREKILACLLELPMGWVKFVEFRSILLRKLLHCILASHDLVAMQASNSGAVLGGLFKAKKFPGDPFLLAVRLLKSGITNSAQADGICAIAHVCHGFPPSQSEASFWSYLGRMVADVGPNAPVGRALLGHLRHLKRNPKVAITLPHPLTPLFGTIDSAKSSPLTNKLNKTEGQSIPLDIKEQTNKTLYISCLPPTMPQNVLMNLLMRAGPVNKVRVCSGRDSGALFAFVEISTVEGELQALQYLKNVSIMGSWIHVQPARNSIQDKQDDDAIYKDNVLIRPCMFGISSMPIVTCVRSNSAKH